MKIKAENLALVIKTHLLALLLFLPAAYATDHFSRSALSSSTALQSKALFKPAAYIMVEHEAFALSTLSPIDDAHVYKKQAYVSIHGAPGESVMYSCNIETLAGTQLKADGSSVTRQGCDGSQAPEPQQIASGQRIYNAVRLTNALMPHPGGPADSRITIEVSYI